jgi:hypothetical protein
MTQAPPNLPFVDLIPLSWFSQPAKSSIWIRGYWARPVPAKHISAERVEFPFSRGVGVLAQGSLKYLFVERPDIEPTETGDARFRTPKRYGWVESPLGTHMILIVPHDVDGTEGNEALTEASLDELEGLLVAYSGHALVYRRLFDNILHLGTGEITVYFGTVDNPAWYDPPQLAEPDLTTLRAVDRARLSAIPALRYRVDLSLRWLAYAARDRDVDAFLKYWIAIETLAMPDGTNVRPANELLAHAYGLSLPEVVGRFCLGRIQGVRSAIVHHGVHTISTTRFSTRASGVMGTNPLDRTGGSVCLTRPHERAEPSEGGAQLAT